MNEVSCRALEPFFCAADRRGIPRAVLTKNVGPLERLQNRHERLDWDVFRQFMANVREYFDEPALREIGARGLKGAGFKSFALIGKTLFSASGFYRWMLTSGGMGNQLFSNLTPSFRELGPGRIDLDLQVAPGYETCTDFFFFAAGGFQALPELVGLQQATVAMTWIERGARFAIEYEAKESRRARLMRRLTRSSDARATAKELNEAIHVLERRNEDLEAMRTLLDLAHQLGERISGERDEAAIARKVCDSVVGHIDVHGVRVTTRNGVVRFGGDIRSLPSTTATLPGAPSWGTVEVWTTSTERAGRLLELITPTVALSIENADAYRELAEYKAGLEKLVDERTGQLRKAHDELAELVAQLRDAQKAREKFFGNVSHEIRTPLSLIVLAAADIERRAGSVLDERARGALGSVTDSARKLVRLVDELLLLAAGQAGKLTLARDVTDLATLLEHILVAWRPAAEAAGLVLSARLAPVLAEVDAVAFERIVSNLVSNAVKYTPHGGAVELTLDETSDGIRLVVADTGPGIDPDLVPRLFGRFERAAGDDRRKAGTGIGLALVKQLVEAHGGSVVARPRSSGGTELVVALPATLIVRTRTATPVPKTALPAAQPIDVVPPASLAPQVFRPPGVSAGTIVVAEDQPQLAESIAQLLATDYTVHLAFDGLAALELVRQHHPQMLITDVEMPGMNGIELARKFRGSTGDPLAPIIILSAVIDLRSRVAGLEAGAVDYVTKPFDPTELTARVHAQFRMRDIAMRLHRAEQLSATGILTSGLAHELRNPANGIVNAIAPLTELLPAELIGPDTDAGQLIDAMRTSAEQIAFLVRQLLGFRHNSDLELRPADFGALVQRAVKLSRDALAGVEVRLAIDVDRRVLCAAPLLVQVLTNLIENAGHAAGRGGWVSIRGTSRGSRVFLEVSDSGPGVPVELRERVFEPFFTTKSPGKGTGLGLSVARAIIHRHNGTLDIRDDGGRSAFVIDLPGESNVVARSNAV